MPSTALIAGILIIMSYNMSLKLAEGAVKEILHTAMWRNLHPTQVKSRECDCRDNQK
jgi:hypothetical protein